MKNPNDKALRFHRYRWPLGPVARHARGVGPGKERQLRAGGRLHVQDGGPRQGLRAQHDQDDGRSVRGGAFGIIRLLLRNEGF